MAAAASGPAIFVQPGGIVTVNSSTFAEPICSVDIYPYEGGAFSLTGAQVIQCNTQKDLRDSGGSATITLAPGGPNGQGFPSWAQVVTLQSLVVVAMQRGNASNVVFVGVVKEVSEPQAWQVGQGVSRNTRIVAADWGSWFQDFNWSSLSFLGITNGAAQAALTGSPADAGLADTQLGLQSVNPAQIAYGWYTQIMGGTKGILADTQVMYNNQTYQWPATTTAFFETYPYSAIFPAANYFISQAGNWYSKFSEILEAPYYELIVGTAPYGVWNTPLVTNANTNNETKASNFGTTAGQLPLNTGGTAWVAPGMYFSSIGLPNAAPAYPQIIGRLCPLPDLAISDSPETPSVGLSGQNAYDYTGVNATAWSNLITYQMASGASFINSNPVLTLGDYYNFFVLNPTALAQVLGISNGAGVFMWAYSGAANIAGIHRFGFKSMIRDTVWLADIGNQVSEGSAPPATLQQLIAALTTRLATFYTPLPLMESGSVEFTLSPEIFVGNIFTYSPFRGDAPWSFYINNVSHTWTFGGPSTTTLGLERGLPQSVYQNLQELQQVIMGNAQRRNGTFLPLLPTGSGPGLQTFNLASNNIQTILGEIAQIYKTPGAA